MSDTFQCPPGRVVVTTWGSILADTCHCLVSARAYCERANLSNIEWQFVQGTLIDKTRNHAMRQMLASPAQWLLFIDADMSWAEDSVHRMLDTAYRTHPWVDVLGGYCTLRQPPHLPTMDTGTGTWESHFPGQGVVEVMRTGAAFLLIKRHVAERIPDPWFALRIPMRPINAIAEVDTFCRTIFDGTNPLRGDYWDAMVKAARLHHSTAEEPYVAAEVGEDSSFCDRVTGAGMRIAVNTDIEVRHWTTEAKDWRDHKKCMDESAKQQRQMAGVFG